MAQVQGKLICDKCGEEIERPKDAWWEHVGWAKRRTQGGIHALKLPVKTDAVVCPACMVRMQMDHEHGPGANPLF